MRIIQLNLRQEAIISIVKEKGPIKEQIANELNLTRAFKTRSCLLVQIGYLGARPRVGYYYSERPRYSNLLRKLIVKVKDFKSVPAVISEKTSVYDAIVALFVHDVGSYLW